MSTLTVKEQISNALSVDVTDDTLLVELDDGRTISVPTAWYPRLFHASKEERNDWRLIGKGNGIHWDAIDEDISIEGLLAGIPSREHQSSLKKWLETRV